MTPKKMHPQKSHRNHLPILWLRRFFQRVVSLRIRVAFGRPPKDHTHSYIILFPICHTVLGCGLTGVVSFKKSQASRAKTPLTALQEEINQLKAYDFGNTIGRDGDGNVTSYLVGDGHLGKMFTRARSLKQGALFEIIFKDASAQHQLAAMAEEIYRIADNDSEQLTQKMGVLDASAVETISRRLELLKDIAWALKNEVLKNVKRTRALINTPKNRWRSSLLQVFAKLNGVCNNIDRLEVRGRDSAGISMMFVISADEYKRFRQEVAEKQLEKTFNERLNQAVLVNGGISVGFHNGTDTSASVSVFFVYKVAAEIGSLGDNIQTIREEIRQDALLQLIAGFQHRHHTVLSHTRWASVGAITEPNCHPLDNSSMMNTPNDAGIIHVCLNGDIDNYLQLEQYHKERGISFSEEISTDTKVIPLQIGMYYKQGLSMEESFRRAVNDFDGSHAIAMHTDLAPGCLFLAQKGSGQAVFVGLAEDQYVPASEVYGFVEQTPNYLKLDGETVFQTSEGPSQGQICILSQESAGGLSGVRAMHYNGVPMVLDSSHIKQTAITTRDIDRQDFPHYFLKEISEAPHSIEKTLQNRWKKDQRTGNLTVSLDATTFPPALIKALQSDRIRRIFFVGQGTAGVAAQVCAEIMSYYLNDPLLPIRAQKASELSGFIISDHDDADSLSDALVIAISQSGTTTDTNRTVDMVRERGARTLAIVNRRDSDLSFKVDGVLYTSSGRDIEMSVASTKAFYSQIVAGALLGLYISGIKQRRNEAFVTSEIGRLLEIPHFMRKILQDQEPIARSAKRLAATKTYWAAVGSGPNKAAADEIRIKLSELCYKTISSDYVEDKKHIDLSSEPLILVCCAGLRATVVGDIVKDTAIFKAHKASPVVITDEGETRFGPYAEDVFYVPRVAEHLAPVLNTLVGHIWGYYAALAINDGSRFFYRFKQSIQNSLDEAADQGLDVYEVVLEKSFREKIAQFYTDYRSQQNTNRFPTVMGVEAASDLTLLLKYLSGRLPVSDFELDFGKKGTALNILQALFECVGKAINTMARPVDAIKHQAKTVTVGTSRISEKVEGLLFETLADHQVTIAQLTPSNVIVLKNLQRIVSGINGSIFYSIGNLNLLGEPSEDTTIHVLEKRGVLAPIPSRVESDQRLKGTKQIIVRKGNVYIGKGRKDDRSILVIPIISKGGATPSRIDHLLLLNISFRKEVSLDDKIKALGGKYQHIKDIVQESSLPWLDAYLDKVSIDELFGRSAEKIGEFISASLAAEGVRPTADK